MIKLSAEQEYLLKTANAAWQLEKDANLMNIPFIKNFAGHVSEGTMDLWRRQHVLAMKSATPAMSSYYNRLSQSASQATGEGKVALDGIQRIIRHVHPIDAPRPALNMGSYGAIGQTAQAAGVH